MGVLADAIFSKQGKVTSWKESIQKEFIFSRECAKQPCHIEASIQCWSSKKQEEYDVHCERRRKNRVLKTDMRRSKRRKLEKKYLQSVLKGNNVARYFSDFESTRKHSAFEIKYFQATYAYYHLYEPVTENYLKFLRTSCTEMISVDWDTEVKFTAC